jgi:hypothetical protein
VTKDEIKTAVLGRLHRTSDTVLATAVDTEILAVQDRLELGVRVNNGTFLPWFLQTDKTDLTYTANVDAVAVPTDFIQEVEEEHRGSIFYYDASLDDPWVQMVREPYSIIKARYAGFSTFPRFYDIWSNQVFVRPRPDAAGTLRILYMARAARLDVVASNAWTNNAAELVICELGYTLANYYIRDQAAAQAFANDAVNEAKRLYVSHISKLEAGRQRSRGDD